VQLCVYNRYSNNACHTRNFVTELGIQYVTKCSKFILPQFLGAFAGLLRTNVSFMFILMSVRPHGTTRLLICTSAWNNSAPYVCPSAWSKSAPYVCPSAWNNSAPYVCPSAWNNSAPYICPSAWNNSAPTEGFLMQLNI
jgi:hypothetical protein